MSESFQTVNVIECIDSSEVNTLCIINADEGNTLQFPAQVVDPSTFDSNELIMEDGQTGVCVIDPFNHTNTSIEQCQNVGIISQAVSVTPQQSEQTIPLTNLQLSEQVYINNIIPNQDTYTIVGPIENPTVLNQLAQNQIVIQSEPVKIENMATTTQNPQNILTMADGKKISLSQWIQLNNSTPNIVQDTTTSSSSQLNSVVKENICGNNTQTNKIKNIPLSKPAYTNNSVKKNRRNSTLMPKAKSIQQEVIIPPHNISNEKHSISLIPITPQNNAVQANSINNSDSPPKNHIILIDPQMQKTLNINTKNIHSNMNILYDIIEKAGITLNKESVTIQMAEYSPNNKDLFNIKSTHPILTVANSIIQKDKSIINTPVENRTICSIVPENSLIHNNSVTISDASTSTNETDLQNKTEKDQDESKPIKKPIIIPGFLAVCNHCGYTSTTINICERCRRTIPENCKTIPQYHKNIKTKIRSNIVKKKSEPAKKIKRQPKKSKTKLIEEPEILTLSSDDENGGEREKDPIIDERIIIKEPIISKEMMENSLNNSNDTINQFLDGSYQGPHTFLQCRSIRVGSYKIIPSQHAGFSENGLYITMPTLDDETNLIQLVIKTSDMLKILYYFGRNMPVLFIYLNPKQAQQIREKLHMKDGEGPYFDPQGLESQKRITLLLETISEDSKTILTHLFTPKFFVELTHPEANEILLRSSPLEKEKKSNLDQDKTLKVQSIKSLATQQRPQNDIQTIMVYPPPPAKGGIPINTEDYACLGGDQFLNDVIIDFYLKYLTLELLTEIDQVRTHIFSSFFYKRLTAKPTRAHPVEDDPKMTPAQKRHYRVKSWTKNVNIFKKDFIIIPINESSHWFLAIICFPGLDGPVRFTDHKELPKLVRKNSSKRKKVEPPGTIQIGSTTITPTKVEPIQIDDPDFSDRDEAEGDDEDLENSSEEELETSKPLIFQDITIKQEIKIKNIQIDAIKQPCILIFDSLAGASRTKVVATLRDYLKCEYKAKEGKEKEFTKDTIKGAMPKVPQQNNFTDCGIYLLQYVESFFQNPINNYKLPIKQLKEWFTNELVSGKREEIQKILLSLMERNNLNIDELNLPQLTFGSSSLDDMDEIDEELDEEELNEDEEDDDDEDEEEELGQFHASRFDGSPLEEGEIREGDDLNIEIHNNLQRELQNIQTSSIVQINPTHKNINCKVVEYDDSSEEIVDEASCNMENNEKVTNVIQSQNDKKTPTEKDENMKDSGVTQVINRNQINSPIIKRKINIESDPKVRKKSKIIYN